MCTHRHTGTCLTYNTHTHTHTQIFLLKQELAFVWNILKTFAHRHLFSEALTKSSRAIFLQVFIQWATSVLTNGAPGAICAPASVLPGLCTYKGTVLSGQLPSPHSSVLSGLGFPSLLLEAAAGCGHSWC